MKKALAIVLAVALLGGGMAVSAQNGYSVSVNGATTDVPTTSVSFGGNSHTISEVAVRSEGGSVTVDAQGQTNESYDVNLYNSDNDVVRSSRKRSGGSSTTSFDLDCCSSGTYAVAVYDSEVQDIAGVVVAGYEVDLDVPSEAEKNSTVDATVTLRTTSGGTIERVEVVLIGDEVVRSTATRQSGSTYTTSVSLDGVSTGDYDAYGVVFGNESFGDEDENEIIGLGSAQSFTVQDDDSGGSVGTGGSDGSRARTDDNDTESGTASPTATAVSPTTMTDDRDTAADGTPPGDGASGTDSDTTDGGEAPTAPDEDATDTDGDDPETVGTDGDGTGLGFPIAAVALAAVVVVVRRRR